MGNAPFDNLHSVKGIGDFNRCLLPMITEDTEFWFRMLIHYRHGILVRDGGLFDQPNIYLEAMEIIGQ